jgi:hypothetical protein
MGKCDLFTNVSPAAMLALLHLGIVYIPLYIIDTWESPLKPSQRRNYIYGSVN